MISLRCYSETLFSLGPAARLQYEPFIYKRKIGKVIKQKLRLIPNWKRNLAERIIVSWSSQDIHLGWGEIEVRPWPES
jgi:hypothetical protein